MDQVSNITPHDRQADTLQRLGAQIGSIFIDGGIPHDLVHVTLLVHYKMEITLKLYAMLQLKLIHS
jgi:hypothetical protein